MFIENDFDEAFGENYKEQFGNMPDEEVENNIGLQKVKNLMDSMSLTETTA